MNRVDNFTLRVNTTERELIAAVARHLDRTESDTMRLLVREKARELGIVPIVTKESRQLTNAPA